MIKTSTQNELIQYVYDELATCASKQLESTMKHEYELADSCADLLLIKRLFSGALKSPSDRAITNILNYSKSLSLQS